MNLSLSNYETIMEFIINSNSQSVLDLGCGPWSPISKIKPKLKQFVGVEGFLPYIEQAKKNKTHTDYIHCDIQQLTNFVVEQSFDAVVAIDVLEHLKKKQGYELLKDMGLVARKLVIVFTPNGFVAQSIYDKNDMQQHLSGWSVNDLKSMGYDVYGFGGFRGLRGEGAQIKLWPKRFWGMVSRKSDYLVRSCPKIAFQLLAVKKF